MKLPLWLQRLGLNDSGVRLTSEAFERQRLADFLVDYRRLCADVGPWEYAADLGAPSDADVRQIAYLAVWRDGPTLQVWFHVKRFDAIDLLIDAAVEGFAEHVGVAR